MRPPALGRGKRQDQTKATELSCLKDAYCQPSEPLPLTRAKGTLTRGSVACGDKHLKPREFDLLAYFLRNHGQVLTRERLLRNEWGYQYAGDSRTVDVHVRWLRGKIETNPALPQRIEAVRGVGYMFTG